MPKLKDYFHLSYGKSIFTKKDIDNDGIYPMITSKGTKNGVWGFTNKKFDYENVISIPRTGTVCHAFYQKLPCLINGDCIVAKPIKTFTENELIYFSLLIRKEKYRFSYSRKVTPQRIGDIKVPSKFPNWVEKYTIKELDKFTAGILDKQFEINISEWKKFKYEDLFNIISGKGPSISRAKKNFGKIPLITATEKNNGISLRTNYEPKHPPNVMTVTKNGSIGEAFYQNEPFCASSDVAVFEPKFQLNQFIAIFLITLIRKEKYRFNYGLKWNLARMKESIIMLPVDMNNKPDWDWIEKYVKSLKYSKNLI